ncbi:MAG: RidA family protein [Burkholderiaceae bacterium]|nr:RidA family protein [Burkholderiaceae bacterium]
MRQLISSGSPFEKTMGYSRAVAQGPFCFVSGTTGYDYKKMEMPDAVAQQAENALNTIEGALEQAGFSLADVVRANYYIADAADADAIIPVLGKFFGEIRPAATLLVTKLMKPEMKIEIDVTAFKNSGA